MGRPSGAAVRALTQDPPCAPSGIAVGALPTRLRSLPSAFMEEGRHTVGICILLRDGLAVLVEDGVAVFVTAGVALGDLAVLDAGHESRCVRRRSRRCSCPQTRPRELGVLSHIGEFRRGGCWWVTFAAACGEQAQGQHKRQDEAAGLFIFIVFVLQYNKFYIASGQSESRCLAAPPRVMHRITQPARVSPGFMTQLRPEKVP